MVVQVVPMSTQTTPLSTQLVPMPGQVNPLLRQCNTCNNWYPSNKALRSHVWRKHKQPHFLPSQDGSTGRVTRDPRDSFMFPGLHEQVKDAVSRTIESPEFHELQDDPSWVDEYDTTVMGRFECHTPSCSMAGWRSKTVAITIRGYKCNRYNAVIYGQRCRACKRLGIMHLDETSYVERVSYRLKKWAGVRMDRPAYREGGQGARHDSRLCEGCKQGHCRRGNRISVL